MKGKILYFVIAVSLACLLPTVIGRSFRFNPSAYDTSFYDTYADYELSAVELQNPEITRDIQDVSPEAISAAAAEAKARQEDLLPCQWEIFFEEELAALNAEKGKDVWTDFPTYAEAPYNSFAILMQIVEAEAGTEDLTGKILVANVILNRIEAGFGDTVREIVFAPTQFDPVTNGSFYTAVPSDETREAVYLAITGENPSQGALYFCTYYKGYGYFSSWATEVVAHGGHVFFK